MHEAIVNFMATEFPLESKNRTH